MAVKPITPKEATYSKLTNIPDDVLIVVNSMLAESFTGSEAIIYLDELISRILNETTITRTGLFENKWLNFEKDYRKSGWKVEFIKPDYNETGRSYYHFKAPI